ncbi:MAG: S-adenosylmethionine:tRNA ribosyltransferase-isomerase, partial [Candidatus Parcubacteria bacterium]|nr:S-adenosylmethionine:tRNA ribosyltransferase-isomerase [Candidatus Parcubacteria bacterium]
LIQQLSVQNINLSYLTLHVGLGTFLPVSTEKIEEHHLHEERAEITPELAEKLNAAKKNHQRIVAVGTTSVRTLEYFASSDQLRSGGEWINLFIYPGYQFKFVDAMVTNFHLPKSSLLMLVSALAGREFILRAYQEAIDKKYRFYSFGDAMLIL